MLHEFMKTNREELVSRCKAKAAKRSSPALMDKELEYGVPVLLDEISEILLADSHPSHVEDPGIEWQTTKSATGIGKTATRHGNELVRAGFTVDQVVHGYGDLCQAVTTLAIERKAPITNDEFKTLNLCLDIAIANAVSEFSRERGGPDDAARAPVTSANKRVFEEELRLINTAKVCVDAIKNGHVGIFGSTGAILDQALNDLQKLAGRLLGEVCAGEEKTSSV